MTTQAYIALGSNLGDRSVNIQSALQQLTLEKGVSLLRVSPVYQTKAIGFTEDVPPFYNGAAEIEVGCSAQELLDILMRIENQMGRTREASQGYLSRTIDLDILLFDEKIIDQPNLQIPHPRMLQRWFVLKPLVDLNPELVIPGNVITAAEALAQLSPQSALSESIVITL